MRPNNQWTACLNRCQLNDKNLANLTRVKYNSELLLHYVFDGISNSENTNVIRVCKVRVKKTCGTLLAHYYAEINISNGYAFEFHPGSQPRTFQSVHTDGCVIMILIMCDECCKNELRQFVKGENGFNVAFKNCESILCKRKSIQTVLVTMALVALFANMFYFSWYYIFFVLFMLVLLYINNNYMISDPQIVFCPHKQSPEHDTSLTRKRYEQIKQRQRAANDKHQRRAVDG
jgi:Baculoviridae AC81